METSDIARTEQLIRHLKITRFLIDMNKMLDGVHISEATEEGALSVKFECQLTCIYASPFMWSPSAAFFSVLSMCLKKHFDIDDYNRFSFNNTNTVFWIAKDELE